MRPMITNGGPHPADKWADMTTDTILDLIQIAEDSVSPEAAAARQAKRDLRPALFAVLIAHHDGVQQQHRKALKKLKACQKSEPIDVTPHLDVAEQVIDLLVATPFKAHFSQPHVQEVARQIVGQHTADVIYIERCWHSDGLSAKGS